MISSKIFREVDGKQVEGVMFPVIVHNFYYFLTQLVIYSDGIIDCWGLMDKKEFLEKINSGWIRIDIPNDSDLYMGMSRIKVCGFVPEKDVEDFIKEIDEAELELSGQKSNRMITVELFKQYLLDDSKKNYIDLSDSFEKLPKHRRALFEYVDKDYLFKIMNEKIEKLSVELRKTILDDYFEDDWNEKDFR